MKSFNLFPTLVKEYNVKGYPRQNELLNAINSHPTTTHGAFKGGKSSYYIKETYNFLKEYNFFDLEEYFTKCVIDYSQEVGIKPGILRNCWFNITDKQSYTARHNHPGATIAGAYYPLLEEGTCDLIFHSPISPLHSTWFQKAIPFTLYTTDIYQIKLKPNHLYLFPGWLDHSTEVNRGEKRIVISFNIGPWNNQI